MGRSENLKPAVAKSDGYLRTKAYKRQQEFKANSAALRAAAPMPLLVGRYLCDMQILVALATAPAFRTVNLRHAFSEEAVRHFKDLDKAGLTVQWDLPYIKGRIGPRGRALALNPDFPFVRELRAMLVSLRSRLPIRLRTDVTSDELHLLPRKPYEGDCNLLLGTKTRTDVLATLFVLGGRCAPTVIEYAIPDSRRANIRDELQRCERGGIIVRTPKEIRFANNRVVRALCCLLRAYVDAYPEFKARAHDLVKEKVEAREQRCEYDLFGKKATTRMLTVLAIHGPMTRAQLEQKAMARSCRGLADHLAMGTVAQVPTTKKRWTTVGLNDAHPLYRELRAVLLKMAGVDPTAASPYAVTKRKPFSCSKMFATQLRLDVLVNLHLTRENEAASLKLLAPKHSQALMAERMRQFEEQGLLVSRDDGRFVMYRLNRRCPYYAELDALLASMLHHFPGRYRDRNLLSYRYSHHQEMIRRGPRRRERTVRK